MTASNANARLAELRGKTAPALLLERARRTGDAVAFRARHLGLYRERTWQAFAELVARTACALESLGLARGERIAIMGDACEEWVILDLAAQSLGAIVYGIYPTAAIAEVEYQLRDGGATIFVAETQEHVDKLLPLTDRVEALRAIVVIDTTAMFAYQHPKLRSFERLLAEVSLPADTALARLRDHVQRLSPDDPAFIVYTSGTTGHPKGALVAHGHHLAACSNIVLHYPTLATDPHRTVAYLPLCHILGRDLTITIPLLSQVVPHFGESVDDLANTFFEVAPTLLFTVPRYLQKFASQILVGVNASSPVKRMAYEWAMRTARQHARGRWEGSQGLPDQLAYRLARTIAFRPLLNKIGFDQLQLVIAGGAAMPSETMALWQMWGVNVVEIYGQTEEAGAMISGQRSPFPRPGNVGVPAAGIEVKLDTEHQILVRMTDHFSGYWNNPEGTREVVGDDGWIRTGDVGEWSEGSDGVRALRLVDRARDFIVTAGGKTLSPSFIENLLRASPYVAEAVVFGHNRKYLTALVEIDFDTVAEWARVNGVVYAGFTQLTQHSRVVALVQGEIDRANESLARVEGIKAFRILPKVLDPEEEGEPVTPTRKVKRAQMQERFRTLVDGMYDDREERVVAAGAGNVLG